MERLTAQTILRLLQYGSRNPTWMSGVRQFSATLSRTGRVVGTHPIPALSRASKVPGITCERPLLSQTRCLSCMKLQTSHIHTTAAARAGKAKNTKRKIVKKKKLPPKSMGEVIAIHENMTVAQLANALGRDEDHIFEVMMYIDNTDKYEEEDSVIDSLTVIKEVVKKSGCRFLIQGKKHDVVKENKDAVKRAAAEPADLVKRPPVVTIMGHVDHGKTTLLDALRHTNVVASEFGGITQHIGAFAVKFESGDSITFLDTPGHAAFSAMRARGAHVTDIIVLVVAADDSVMKQTVESIHHARDAGVPVIVAINKIDKAEADIEQCKKDLLSQGVVLEEVGGDVQVIPVSALKGTNLDVLHESILALAEVMELKADPAGLVEGTVIESRTDPGRGKLSTVLIQRGTLKKGAHVVAGEAWGRVRGMFQDTGKPVQRADPSTPVEVIGWKELPSAGETFLELESEHRVKEVIHWRKEQAKENKAAEDLKVIQEKIEKQQTEHRAVMEKKLALGSLRYRLRGQTRTKEAVDVHEGPELSLVLKADVDGSLEAILDTLESYRSEQCRLNIIHYGVGGVSQHDIELAQMFNGVVLGFNVQVPDSAMKLAKSQRVPVRKHNIIYRLIDDVTAELTSRLPTVQVEHLVGEANVLDTFMVTTEGKKKIPVAGCRCTKGTLDKKKRFRLLRDGEEEFDGELHSLRHLKNEVESVKKDVECGLSFDDLTLTARAGDIIVCYEMKEEPQKLDWDLDF